MGVLEELFGLAVLAPSVASWLMSRVRAPVPGLLSQREQEVLELVAAGTTNPEAAARLFITDCTVKTHLLHIYAKLGVADRAAAVAEAFHRGPRGGDRHHRLRHLVQQTEQRRPR